MTIWRRVDVISAATAEHLTFGKQLRVNFQPYDSLVFHMDISLETSVSIANPGDLEKVGQFVMRGENSKGN